MRTPSSLKALSLCTLAALAFSTGCTNPDPDVAPTAVESWTAEDEATAIADAEQAIRDWMYVGSQCLADPPNTDPSCFDDVATDDFLIREREALEDAQDEGFRYLGAPKLLRTERVVFIQLTVGTSKEVQLSVCTDRTDYDVLMPDGTSGIPPGTPAHTRAIYTVRKHARQWKVADITPEDPEHPEC